MPGASKPRPEPSEIGLRARTIRRRRGLSLETAAGLAGLSKTYLSYLERGIRGFERRGLLEDVARALGCSVIDLTGQPYLPADRDSAEALATLPAISMALYDATLDDVPDMSARSVDELAPWAAVANEHTANSRYAAAGRDLGTLLVELYVQAAIGNGDTRRAALAALVEACFVASGVARALGNPDLSSAQMAAKDRRADETSARLVAARELAERTGERNRLWFSFGPANVRAWSLSVAVELGEGPALAEQSRGDARV